MTIPAELLLALAGSLLHFLWQGAVLALLAAALMMAFRTPSERYLIGVGTLGVMFASFGVTFALLNSPAVTGEELVASPSTTLAAVATPVVNVAHMASGTPATSPQEFLWVAQGWLAGVFVLALRLACGLVVIEYLRRRRLVALPGSLVARFRALQARMGVTRHIRFRECAQVAAPAVIGLFRPIVLVPVRALTGLSTEQLEAVIAHELAHVRRFDVAVNFFQVVAETLFFFHPAVWWLNRRIRADREDCCDDVAVSMAGDRLQYAKALATMATWRATPRFAMAATGGPLATRVSRLLGAGDASGRRTTGVVASVLVLATAAGAAALSLSLVRPAVARSANDETIVVVAQADAPVAAPAADPAPVPNPRPAPAARAVPAKPAREAQQAQPVQPAQPANPRSQQRPATGESYLEGIRATGLEPTVDQLVALKVHDVTPEYVKAMRATGLEFDVDTLIALKTQDVTPEFVATLRNQGFTPDVDELIAMKVHGVTAEYLKAWETNGFKPSLDELISGRIHEITPEFLAKARAHGFDKLSFQQLIQLKIADVL